LVGATLLLVGAADNTGVKKKPRKNPSELKQEISQLREALLDITGVLNRPQPDAALIALAGIDLDRALFPLLVRVERRGPLAIGELAELCGRNYTTVSRQMTKLEELGLVDRRPNAQDARVTEAIITAKGRTMTHALDGAREKIMTSLLGDWEKTDVAELARLLRKLADDALELVRSQSSRSD
jgi:DNA-binding MarR family transcriptional regulator